MTVPKRIHDGEPTSKPSSSLINQLAKTPSDLESGSTPGRVAGAMRNSPFAHANAAKVYIARGRGGMPKEASRFHFVPVTSVPMAVSDR